MKSIGGILIGITFLASCIGNTTVSPLAQFKSDTTSLGSYLRQNNIAATKVSAGVWYVVDSIGVGIYPALSDSVKISYSASLIPSLAKVDTAQNLNVLLSSTISGIQLCLPSFPVGSRGRIYIPSGLAFGAIAHQSSTDYTIPANSNLLYKIKVTSAAGTKLASDVAAIDSYLGVIADSLIAKQITVINDPSGIRYSVSYPDAIGTSPTLQDMVTVTYTGNLLRRDSLFANVATPTKLALKDQIAAWKIILPKLKEGAVATLYVPSGYGYGNASTTKVPAYSNLVYQLQLIKVN